MEYVPNGTLSNYIEQSISIDGNDVKLLFLQLMSVLDYLHNVKHIIHRDLKSQNIMLDKKYNIRVVDFGLSKIVQSDDLLHQTRCGTPLFTAPEIIVGNPYNNKCDIWSTGIILYHMLLGKLPFYDRNLNFLFQKIAFTESDFSGISADLTSLIKGLLKKNPKERHSLSDILDSHCFQFTDYHRMKTVIIETAMRMFDVAFSIKDFEYIRTNNQLLIKLHIKNKEEITDFIQVLNHFESQQFQLKKIIVRERINNHFDKLPHKKITHRFSTPTKLI
jgi:serine/threonine protein kinase